MACTCWSATLPQPTIAIRWLRSREMNSWIVHSNDIENEPDRIIRSEACFGPVVHYYRGEKAQSISPPFKILKKLRAYFPECHNKEIQL